MGSIGSETNASALSSRADFLAGAYYQRFWLDHSAARMRGFENVGAFPGIIVWQLGVDGPFTDVYSNGTWPYYGGDRDVLTGMRPPRVVGVGDVQTWEAFDGSVMVGNLPSNEAVRVKITGNATGGGKYTGRTISAATSDVSNSSDLAEGDLGTVASADNCLILNTGEIGESTHDLTDSDSDDGNLYHVGAIIRTNSDGTVVVQINDRGECTS
jgi:hypothetical protein